MTRLGILRSAARSQRHDGVGNAVADAIVDAADSAAEVDDAIGLTALQDGEADQRPAVGEIACDIVLVDKVGQPGKRR